MPSQVGPIQVHQRHVLPVSHDPKYAGFNPSSTVLPAGHKKTSEYRAFPVDTILDRDVGLPTRDGFVLRADVYRPADESRVIPAIIAWGPYGKSGSGFLSLDVMFRRMGIPRSMVSGYESFEAPDPAEWIQRGYAIVNVDARGAFDSEGDLSWFGTAEGRDGYDAVEAVAKLPWCNGNVSMGGNSWLAVAQWFTAAEKPPSLKCIAPFEGFSDFYREVFCRGGVPFPPFWNGLASHFYGHNQQEDVLLMHEQYPFVNEYWADKRARLQDIEIPTFILGSWSTMFHTVGSFRAFEEIKHDKKWLRVHPTQEWHDLYQKETVDELAVFFDRYLKNIDNAWEEKTPSVRISLLGFNRAPIVNHVFPTWPIPDTTVQSLYLGPSSQLLGSPPSQSTTVSYKSDAPAMQVDDDNEEIIFTHTFERTSYLLGHSKAVLYMSCDSSNDMDVFVQLRKVSAEGKVLRNYNVPLKDLGLSSTDEIELTNPSVYLGPTGILRASRRALDSNLSTERWAVHSHTQETEQKVKDGEVVKLEIGIWPTGMVFDAGEKLMLKVAGHHMVLAEMKSIRGKFIAGNKGQHNVHFGGQYDSHIEIPLVKL